jgi:hypothetical protein
VEENHRRSNTLYRSPIHERENRSVPGGILKYKHDVGKTLKGEVKFDIPKRRVRKRTRVSPAGFNAPMRHKLNKAMLRISKGNRTRKNEFVVDSGATTHLVKSSKWLGRILNRHKMLIRDAVGKEHGTDLTATVKMMVKKKDGTYHAPRDMGTGSTLNMLMHNLLSVSTLCRNGYSVVFKPDRGEIHTPDKTIIPLTQDGGLYFVEGSTISDVRQTMYSKKC